MKLWPRRPNPHAVARIASAGTHLIPAEPARLREPARRPVSTEKTTTATRPPATPTWGPCGHCSHGAVGHGVQYGALIGWHTWAPERAECPKTWSEVRRTSAPEGDPR